MYNYTMIGIPMFSVISLIMKGISALRCLIKSDIDT